MGLLADIWNWITGTEDKLTEEVKQMYLNAGASEQSANWGAELSTAVFPPVAITKGMDAMSQFFEENPDAGGLLASINSGLNPIAAVVFFSDFIMEESAQTLSMGIWQLVEAEEYEAADELLDTYNDFLDVVDDVREEIEWINPLAVAVFTQYFKAARDQAGAWEKVINKGFEQAPGKPIFNRWEELKNWHDKTEDTISLWYDEEKDRLKDKHRERMDELKSEHKRRMYAITDRKSAENLSREEVHKLRADEFERYDTAQREEYTRYDKAKRILREEYNNRKVAHDREHEKKKETLKREQKVTVPEVKAPKPIPPEELPKKAPEVKAPERPLERRTTIKTVEGIKDKETGEPGAETSEYKPTETCYGWLEIESPTKEYDVTLKLICEGELIYEYDRTIPKAPDELRRAWVYYKPSTYYKMWTFKVEGLDFELEKTFTVDGLPPHETVDSIELIDFSVGYPVEPLEPELEEERSIVKKDKLVKFNYTVGPIPETTDYSIWYYKLEEGEYKPKSHGAAAFPSGEEVHRETNHKFGETGDWRVVLAIGGEYEEDIIGKLFRVDLKVVE